MGVADEGEVFCRGVQAAVADGSRYRVVAFGSTAGHAKALARVGALRALLVSWEMIRPRGPRFMEQLTAHAPALKIGVITSTAIADRSELASVGADAVLQRTCSTAELVSTLDTLLPDSGSGTHMQRSQLTVREFEVLRLLALAASTRDIAQWLGIAEGTVKRHISNIGAKLGTRSRLEAVTAARARGLCS